MALGVAASSEEVAGQSPKRTVNQHYSVLGRPEGASLCPCQSPHQTPWSFSAREAGRRK